MRFAEHSLHCYRLPYERPVKWSDIVETAAPFVLLRLQSDTGAVGVGEITVKPTWCGVTARSLIAAIEDVFLPFCSRPSISMTRSRYARCSIAFRRTRRRRR
jgi:L-alanine-DL-glutamate epimerase-like enolase superfamily enzyme